MPVTQHPTRAALERRLGHTTFAERRRGRQHVLGAGRHDVVRGAELTHVHTSNDVVEVKKMARELLITLEYGGCCAERAELRSFGRRASWPQ